MFKAYHLSALPLPVLEPLGVFPGVGNTIAVQFPQLTTAVGVVGAPHVL